MDRTLSESEKIYTRVKQFLNAIPDDVRASLRVQLRTPKYHDSLRKSILRNQCMVSFEHDESGYGHHFWYGVKEFDEMVRQII